MTTPRPGRRAVLLAGAAGAAAVLPIAGGSKAEASPAHPGTARISWPDDQALPCFAEPRRLDVADVAEVPDDEKVMFATLQGVVNRSRPAIYLLHNVTDSMPWLRDLDVPWTERGRWKVLRRHLASVSGMVVWDPAVPDTVNAATTLAGIHGALAVSPRLADRLAAAPYELEIVDDLRGRFNGRLEVYTWQFDELWSRTTDRMLVALDPEVHLGNFRDYAVANDAMVFWLEVNAAAERALFERILDAVEPYTPYLGWFASDIAGEFAGTELVSSYSAYVVPADWLDNATVFAGVRTRISDEQPAPPTPALENKIYVTFTMGEGDNLQYNQHYLRELWADSRRGSVPINWTTSPLLADAAPAILAYFQRTATRNDYFVAGPSGAGYIYPTPWPAETFSAYTAKTGTYMAATGLDTIQILNRVANDDVDLGEGKAAQLAADAEPRGWFIHHTDHTELRVLAGVPQVTNHLVSDVAQTKQAIAKAADGWDGQAPLFVGIAPLAWDMTPTDLAEVAASLGTDYVVVRGDHFFDLAREALGLTP